MFSPFRTKKNKYIKFFKYNIAIQRPIFFLFHTSVQNKVNDSKLSVLDACNLFLALDTTFKMIPTKWNIFNGAQPEAASHNYIRQAGHLRNS